MWKIPGGLIDPGEFIGEAGIREVWEETGIKTEFVSLAAFKENRSFRFSQPDIYFVVLLKPLSFEINIDPREVKQAKWMKVVILCLFLLLLKVYYKG